MAEQNTTEETITEPAGTTEASSEEKDWKAEYDKLLAKSRRWEDRAKKNAQAAKELDDIKAQTMTDAEKLAEATKRAEAAEARIAEFEQKAERASLVAEIAQAKGLDAEWLARMAGDDQETIEANADFLIKKLESQSIYPVVADKGQPKARQMTDQDVRDIKDHTERIKARAQSIAQKRQ